MIDFQAEHESVTWIHSWFGGDVRTVIAIITAGHAGGLSMVMR